MSLGLLHGSLRDDHRGVFIIVSYSAGAKHRSITARQQTKPQAKCSTPGIATAVASEEHATQCSIDLDLSAPHVQKTAAYSNA